MFKREIWLFQSTWHLMECSHFKLLSYLVGICMRYTDSLRFRCETYCPRGAHTFHSVLVHYMLHQRRTTSRCCTITHIFILSFVWDHLNLCLVLGYSKWQFIAEALHSYSDVRCEVRVCCPVCKFHSIKSNWICGYGSLVLMVLCKKCTTATSAVAKPTKNNEFLFEQIAQTRGKLLLMKLL